MEKRSKKTGEERRIRAFCGRLTLLFLLLAGVLFSLLSCGREEPETPAPDQPGTEPPSESTGEALPEGWIRREMPREALMQGDLVLVNADHDFDPELPETVSVYENKNNCYLVKDVYLSLCPEALDALNRWMGAFCGQTGLTDVNVVAGYRTRADQQALYENAVATKGRDHAEAYLALPGCSEHHTGLALDLDTYDVAAGTSGGFDGEGDYAWAVEHAWEYGFIQRYPPHKSDVTGIRYESWHFRYVGIPHAWLMKQENLCLEEYIEYLRDFSFDRGPLTVTCLGRSWRIYYAAGTSIPVPAAGNYEISGNNVDGFVVTIED